MNLQKRLMAWRHQLHQIPEFGFDEELTSWFVANTLCDMGIDVHTGIGGTGVVASIKCGSGERSIGLRADLDALKIQEQNDVAYASQHPGMMHACGHDGHMAMLLGAASLLKDDSDFDGTVYCIFQPAEEHGKGALAMIDDGLFERWSIDQIYAIHNLPGIEAGHFALCSGAIMASESAFECRLVAKGGHAAMPHRGQDPIVVAAQIILAMQTITSRRLNAVEEQAVVSITEMLTNGDVNILPSEVVLKGDVRCFSATVRTTIQEAMQAILDGHSQSAGMTANLRFNNNFPEMINSLQQAQHATNAAKIIAGAEAVNGNCKPFTISDDFAFMLQHKPGCYLLLGNGDEGKGATALHTSNYDFNDDVLVRGARFWQELVKQVLPVSAYSNEVSAERSVAV